MKDPYLQSLLGENEQVVLITRQHIFLLLRSMVWEVMTAIAILVVVTALAVFLPDPFRTFAPVGYALLLIPLIGVIIDAVVWTNKMHIVTTRRVIQLSGVFNKNVTDSSLEKVNDVKMEQSFLGRVFDYGDVEILTASELGVNVLRMISHPIQFKTAMLNAKEQMGSDSDFGYGASRPRRDLSPADVPDMIAKLDELRRQGILSEEEFRAKKAELLSKLD